MLPKKPSALLRVALADMELCEDNPNFSIDMTSWFSPSVIDDRCFVCMAGAVMAQTLKSPTIEPLCPSDFDNYVVIDALKALDELRRGNIGQAAMWLDCYEVLKSSDFNTPLEMGFAEDDEYSWEYINSEANDLPRFYADMEELAQELERVGL
jgi:hypothetical protein